MAIHLRPYERFLFFKCDACHHRCGGPTGEFCEKYGRNKDGQSTIPDWKPQVYDPASVMASVVLCLSRQLRCVAFVFSGATAVLDPRHTRCTSGLREHVHSEEQDGPRSGEHLCPPSVPVHCPHRLLSCLLFMSLSGSTAVNAESEWAVVKHADHLLC